MGPDALECDNCEAPIGWENTDDYGMRFITYYKDRDEQLCESCWERFGDNGYQEVTE
jgi:hypothetical protein